MMTNRDSNRRRRAGFSMIEVLVASSILVVIVMMLAMLFQQTSLAWRTGVRRANRYMQVRSAIGAIQRDAAAAVDARYIPQELKTLIGSQDQSFKGSLNFYTLNGTGFENNRTDGTPLRSLSYITYDTRGQRTETVLNGLGRPYIKDERSQTMNFLQKKTKGSALSQPKLLFDFAQSVSAQNRQPAGNNEFPLFITIKVTFTPDDGNGYDIGAASAGPDKIWNTKDDIRTWTER